MVRKIRQLNVLLWRGSGADLRTTRVEAQLSSLATTASAIAPQTEQFFRIAVNPTALSDHRPSPRTGPLWTCLTSRTRSLVRPRARVAVQSLGTGACPPAPLPPVGGRRPRPRVTTRLRRLATRAHTQKPGGDGPPHSVRVDLRVLAAQPIPIAGYCRWPSCATGWGGTT